MQILKDTPFEVGHLDWEMRPGTPTLTVVVKATYALVPAGVCPLAEEQAALSGETFYEDDAEQSPLYPGDFSLLKPRAECMVIGRVHPPGGGQVVKHRGAFQIGGVGLQLRFYGDRVWGPSGPGEPSLYESIPLRWERCFGGPGFEENPLGVGFFGAAGSHPQAARMPNIERGEAPLRSREDRPSPAATIPVPAAYRARQRHAGTYDERWLKGRWPWFAEDMEWEHFNSAPPELRLRGFLRGDERIQLINLHARHPKIDCALPNLQAKAFLREGAQAALRPMPLRLDTVIVDLDASQVITLSRGLAEVDSARVEHLFVVHHEAGERLTSTQYELWYERTLAKRDEGAEPTPEARRGGEVTLAWRKAEHSAAEKAATLIFARELDPQGEGSEATTGERAVAGVGGPEDEEEQRLQAGRAGRWRALLGLEPLPGEEQQAAEAADVEALGARWAHLDQAQTLRGGEGPLEGIGVPTEGFPTLRFRDPGSELASEEMAELGAAILAEQSLSEEELRRLREEVQAALASGEGCAGWDLTGADLSGFRFEGGDLSRAILKRANLAGASFLGATLDGATLDEADLSGARFHQSSLKEAVLSGARAEAAQFSECDLSGLIAHHCHLAEARFLRCNGEKASFSGSLLVEVLAEESRFSGALFDRAILTGARFARSELVEASFEGGAIGRGLILDGCDLRDLRASGGALLRGVSLRMTQAAGANFSGAEMQGADLRSANLDQADLSGARLDEAQMSGCRLRGARLDGGGFARANLRGADLLGAQLPEADLRGCDLRDTNLYQANLYAARAEGARLDRANINGTLWSARGLG